MPGTPGSVTAVSAPLCCCKEICFLKLCTQQSPLWEHLDFVPLIFFIRETQFLLRCWWWQVVHFFRVIWVCSQSLCSPLWISLSGTDYLHLAIPVAVRDLALKILLHQRGFFKLTSILSFIFSALWQKSSLTSHLGTLSSLAGLGVRFWPRKHMRAFF